MRNIDVKHITELVEDLVRDTVFSVRKDVEDYFKQALKLAKDKYKNNQDPKQANIVFVWQQLCENLRLAKQNKVPYCQDTGQAVFFVEIGDNVHINGNITKAINLGLQKASKKYFLRASIVKDPILRENTKTNSPAQINYEIVKGEKLKISILLKGGGSENKSKLVLLNPTATKEEIQSEVIKIVKEIGSDACPPYVVGIGLGGSSDKALLIAKKALLRPLKQKNSQKHLQQMEEELLRKLNDFEIGPLGFGGNAGIMAVKINALPTHIAILPMAVSISCHALRSKSMWL